MDGFDHEALAQRTIVYAGSSIAHDEARRAAPEFCYLPPVRGGDISRAMRLQPRAILIIDGVFERTAAVWHKEILDAIGRGVMVVGASSMGALRAAELHPLGMIGIGEVFRDYREGVLEDDDDVAVLLSGITYAAQTLPMVNVRATLLRAHRAGVIDADVKQRFERATKRLAYQERTLEALGALGESSGVAPGEVQVIANWIREHGIVDQKRQDAVEALEALRAGRIANMGRRGPVGATSGLRRLQLEASCRPMSSDQEWLPREERIALTARLFGDGYRAARRLAYFMRTVCALQRASDEVPSPDARDAAAQGVITRPAASTIGWREALEALETALPVEVPAVDSFVEDILRWDGGALGAPSADEVSSAGRDEASCAVSSEASEAYARAVRLTARAWRCFEGWATHWRLDPTREEVMAELGHFRRLRALQSKTKLEEWLRTSGVDESWLLAFIARLVRFRRVILEDRLEFVGAWAPDDVRVWWLGEALRASGLDIPSARLLDGRVVPPEVLARMRAIDDEDAFSLDFVGGEHDARSFVASLRRRDTVREGP